MLDISHCWYYHSACSWGNFQVGLLNFHSLSRHKIQTLTLTHDFSVNLWNIEVSTTTINFLKQELRSESRITSLLNIDKYVKSSLKIVHPPLTDYRNSHASVVYGWALSAFKTRPSQSGYLYSFVVLSWLLYDKFHSLLSLIYIYDIKMCIFPHRSCWLC